METEAEMGGRRPPAQGWAPGAPRSWSRQEGLSPGASGWSSALGPLELTHLVPRTGGAQMSVVLIPHSVGICYGRTQDPPHPLTPASPPPAEMKRPETVQSIQ